MWLLFLLIFVNAIADNKTFILQYRLDVGVPINILDGLLIIGVIVALSEGIARA